MHEDDMPPNDLPGLSEKEYLILNLLIGSPAPMYGLAMVEQSDGKLKRGTIYTTLNRLEEKGYITSKREEAEAGLQPRRLYKPTGQGVKVFRAIESTGGRKWLKEAFAS
jgi:DNA-binding PadR family transcriptional regulator